MMMPACGHGRWRLLSDDGADAAGGLALDEALMARYARGEPDAPPTLRLYSYRSHCALVGRYQNLEAEVDLAACAATGTPVSRRPTGGGAIIMGGGQLGVAFAARAPAGRRPREIIADMSAGLAAGLAALGVDATFRGKNDLEAGGRKIAGLGLYIDDGGAMLFHASVLGDLDVDFMLRVLRIPAAKLGGRAAAAVAERVTTVTRETGRPHDAVSLRPVIAGGFAAAFGVGFDPAEPDGSERVLAGTLAARYRSSSWLSERSAAADATGSALLKTPAGLARIYLTTHGDLIKSAMVVGDFNEMPAEVVRLEAELRWRRLSPPVIAAAVGSSGAGRALGLPDGRLATAIMEAGWQSGYRAAAAPARSAGSCYFPEAEAAAVPGGDAGPVAAAGAVQVPPAGAGQPAGLAARSREEEA